MDKYEVHELILKHVCKEIEQIAEQIQNGQAVSQQTIEMLDKLYHLKKSMLTCEAMEEAEEYGEGGFSGRRGRAANGRYVSRDAGGSQQSYADGYSKGYSEAMEQMNNGGSSGHYPMMGGYPPRRW